MTTADGDYNTLIDSEEDTAALCLHFKQWKIKYLQNICTQNQIRFVAISLHNFMHEYHFMVPI